MQCNYIPVAFGHRIEESDKEASIMYIRIFKCLLLLLVGLAIATPASAEDKKAEESSKGEVRPAPVAKDTAKVKVSNAFLNRWKKIQKVTKKQAYETQQTRTVAGVRGAEAEDAVLDQLYYKGGVRYPSRVDLKNAISQLQEAIKADPNAEAVPEQKFFIAQCHNQLGETDLAKATYNDLIKNHKGNDWAGKSQAEIEKFADK